MRSTTSPSPSLRAQHGPTFTFTFTLTPRKARSLRAQHGHSVRSTATMCGRYTLHIQQAKLAEAIALALPDDYAPDYNIGPGRESLSIVAHDQNQPAATMMHWGLRTPQNFHINARIETADTTPRFRESWYEHRCLLPANGFYEWYQDGITKQPYYIYPSHGQPLFFAGLWFPAAEAEQMSAFVILTMPARPTVQRIHDRMPVILDATNQSDWLSGRLNKSEAITSGNSLQLEMHTVTRRVNSVRNKDNRLIEATSPLNDDQMMLF